MKFFLTLSTLLMLIVLATAQYFGQYNTYSGDFGGPSAFGSASLNRDNRENRGPVVFPMSPPDAPSESSGVVIGASGFGFVPPGQQRFSGFRSNY